MHTVYHLPEFVWSDGRIGKIGCTKKYPQRCLDQGHTNYEVLFTHEDGWIAGDKELELQAEYGYPIDTCHYMISIENRRKGGLKGGRKNADSGKLLETQRKGSRKRRVLTFEQAQEIRAKYTGKRGEQINLAKEYGVSKNTIFRIIYNETYQVR